MYNWPTNYFRAAGSPFLKVNTFFWTSQIEDREENSQVKSSYSISWLQYLISSWWKRRQLQLPLRILVSTHLLCKNTQLPKSSLNLNTSASYMLDPLSSLLSYLANFTSSEATTPSDLSPGIVWHVGASSATTRGSIPTWKITSDVVFSTGGFDYVGPVYIKLGAVRRPVTVKAFISVFVSLSLC